MFAIANHRLFRDGDRLIVPYEARGRLSVFEIRDGESALLAEHTLPHGTLLTDALLADTANVQGLAIDPFFTLPFAESNVQECQSLF